MRVPTRSKRTATLFPYTSLVRSARWFYLAFRVSIRIDFELLTSFTSRRAEYAGILSAWVGTTLVMIVTAILSVPLGVMAGIYLEEYAPKNWMTTLIDINISNLAGVPSIISGLLPLGLFVYMFGIGDRKSVV